MPEYSLNEAIEHFIYYCKFEKQLSIKTIKSYNIDLTQLSSFLIENKYSLQVINITKNEIRQYLELLSIFKPKTIKRKIATIKAMFNFLEFEDKILINPIRKMRIKIKEPVRLPKCLDLKEIYKILKTAYKLMNLEVKNSYSYSTSVRNIAILEMLFATGARVSEIANLRQEDINLNSGIISIKGKGDKERIAQICNKDVLSILVYYRRCFAEKMNSSGGYFFINRLNKKLSDQSIRIIVKCISKKASIQKHVTPHIFRHTFATLLLERDVDIKYIQSLLGHSSITTTQIYTQVNKEKQRKILITKHPRKEFSIQNSVEFE